MIRFLTATALAAAVILADRWRRNLLRAPAVAAPSSETQRARRLHLNEGSALKSILARMRRVPSYRPRGFAPGAAGLHQAEQQVANAREVLQEIRSEGDA